MTAHVALKTKSVEKVWGKDILPAPFLAPEGQRIGEIWFEPAPPCADLLAKYLFTSEKLSVQVHPSDAQAPEGLSGKEECWLVLDADPGATLAIGFRQPLGPDAIRAAALDGSIEQLLEWHPAKRGDFFYLPAGTVHAIGPGLSLVEIQQNSDITYRLFDYGRPRQLHLDAAIAVAQGARHPADLRRTIDMTRSAQLVSGSHFRLDLLAGPPDQTMLARFGGPVLVMPLSGEVTVADECIAAGECAAITALASAGFSSQGLTLIAQSLR
ncbi:class I mannose-6-phosphate isomerase [Pontixanthobacter sp.]|uniref:class I mannose-6-phosphate isomerase n=1 Tax=Pontixanthobacter sp. TaxID=2792078 RepID=UPI003C7E3848